MSWREVDVTVENPYRVEAGEEDDEEIDVDAGESERELFGRFADWNSSKRDESSLVISSGGGGWAPKGRFRDFLGGMGLLPWLRPFGETPLLWNKQEW